MKTAFKPNMEGCDQFGRHEALHTAWVMSDAFEKYVADHPAVKRDAVLYAKALKVSETLADFYQEVAARNIAEDRRASN